MSSPKAVPQTAPPAGAAPPAAEEGAFSMKSIFRMLTQVAAIYMVTQIATRFLSNAYNAPAPQPVAPGAGFAVPQARLEGLPGLAAQPLWSLGTNLDMHVYLSTSPYGYSFDGSSSEDKALPHFVWKDIWFGNWKEKREVDLELTVPASVMHNGSMWADIFVTAESAHPDPKNPAYNPRNIYHGRKLLTRYMPKRIARKEKKLIGTGPEDALDEEEIDPKEKIIVPHWHSNLTLTLISDTPDIAMKTVAPAIAPYVKIAPWTADTPGVRPLYYPIVYANDFWLLREHMMEINTTTPTLLLHVTFHPLSYVKFNIYSSMQQGFEQQSSQGLGAGEVDELKRMLTETNPILLGTTFVVSILHTLFEFLAFKNDVMHWRKKEEMVGVSLRTIIANIVVQLVILLYLLDNNQDTSWMILMGQGVGLAIEGWKITKAVDITVVPTKPGSRLPYWIQVTDKHKLSEDEKKTQEYDKLAFRYVSYFAIPSLAGYTIYSMIYETHRGWYSFIITTLTSFVYMFGFVQLIPQLIINYKMKSVAHMPMKAMIYKTLGTVVDDFFAFCIKMPWLHRLACFRDDAVFLVFLYQRWIYRIDYKRANEYGQLAVDGIQDDKKELTKDVKVTEEDKKTQ